MTTHVVEIGRRKFVGGLFWQSLAKPRELRKEAVELAGRIEADLFVLRRDAGVAQAGYAHSQDGAQPGMASLAAALAAAVAARGVALEGRRQPPHHWLGAFELPGGPWLYLAVRDDGFLPNGDFCGTREEVQDRLLQDYGLGGWNAVVGEASLEAHGFHNYEAARLDELLPVKRGGIKLRREWLLQPVRRKAPWRVIVPVVLVLGALAAGALAWWSHLREQEREAALEKARRQLAARQAEAQKLPHPWPLKPLPEAYARACRDRLRHVAPAGWHLEEFSCTAGQATHVWTRGLSNVAWLRERLPDAVVELAGDRATLRQDFSAGAGTDEALALARDAIVPFMGEAQRMGLGVVLTPAPVPPPPPPPAGMAQLGAAPKPQPPDWQAFNFTLKAGGVPPTAIAARLARPGVRFNKISYRKGEWQIEGTIYAK